MNSSNPPGAPVSQTRSFSTVFLIELWERFGYYGMAALLVLFMIDKLNFTDSHATLTWGAFTALVYASPSIGGWIGAVLGAPLFVLIIAGVLTGIFNGLLGAEIRFAQGFAVAAYAAPQP